GRVPCKGAGANETRRPSSGRSSQGGGRLLLSAPLRLDWPRGLLGQRVNWPRGRLTAHCFHVLPGRPPNIRTPLAWPLLPSKVSAPPMTGGTYGGRHFYFERLRRQSIRRDHRDPCGRGSRTAGRLHAQPSHGRGWEHLEHENRDFVRYLERRDERRRP